MPLRSERSFKLSSHDFNAIAPKAAGRAPWAHRCDTCQRAVPVQRGRAIEVIVSHTIDLDALPTNKGDIQKIQPEFPRLKIDSPAGCPCPMAEIRRYVTAETGRKGHDLFFGRTALVGDVHFWLWGLIDQGETCFVDVSARGDRSFLSMGSGEGLTPEQFIALQYARHWRGRRT
jgi:hypothetical protein